MQLTCCIHNKKTDCDGSELAVWKKKGVGEWGDFRWIRRDLVEQCGQKGSHWKGPLESSFKKHQSLKEQEIQKGSSQLLEISLSKFHDSIAERKLLLPFFLIFALELCRCLSLSVTGPRVEPKRPLSVQSAQGPELQRHGVRTGAGRVLVL